MKNFKFFSIAVIAALLLAPTTAMAKTNFSISLNLIDFLAPRFFPAPVVVAPVPPPVYVAPVTPVVIVPPVAPPVVYTPVMPAPVVLTPVYRPVCYFPYYPKMHRAKWKNGKKHHRHHHVAKESEQNKENNPTPSV